MMPCSSGNSPTISETRSALHRAAARRACDASAPGTPSASLAASTSSRRTLSPSEPSLAWNTMPSSPGTRLASVALRSLSKKNFASQSLARSTRSLPATIAASSSAQRLATITKRAASRPSPSSSARYFWCWRIEVTSTSCGRSMKRCSIRPSSGTGHSTRPASSPKQARIVAHTQLRRVRQPVRPGRDPPLALGTVQLDVRRRRAFAGSPRSHAPRSARAPGSDAQRSQHPPSPARTSSARPRHPAGRRCRAAAAPSAPRSRPSASTWARESGQDLDQQRPEHGAGGLAPPREAGHMHPALAIVLLLEPVVVDTRASPGSPRAPGPARRPWARAARSRRRAGSRPGPRTTRTRRRGVL